MTEVTGAGVFPVGGRGVVGGGAGLGRGEVQAGGLGGCRGVLVGCGEGPGCPMAEGLRVQEKGGAAGSGPGLGRGWAGAGCWR